MAGRADMHTLRFDRQADGPAPCPYQPVTEDAARELHLASAPGPLRRWRDVERQAELF